MELKVVNLLLAGSRWRNAVARESVQFVTGEKLLIDVVDQGFIDTICAQGGGAIADTPLDEIVAFLYNAGQNWKRRDYVRRSVYERNLVRYLGYSKKAATTEADWIALLLSSSFRLYDILSVELGTWQAVDTWIAREEALVRALPRGRVLHLAPGNVPLSAVISVLRALVTKNTSIVKVSTSDPFTAPALLQSFAEIDPNHPVTRAVSTVYWPTRQADEIGANFAKMVDTIVAWGGEEAIAWARRAAGPDTDVVEFGPKQSFAVVGPNDDLAGAARGVAIDMCLYDQKACFSTRKAFVHRSCFDRFSDELDLALTKLEQLLPMGCISDDQLATRTLARAHADFVGSLTGSTNGAWTLVRQEPNEPTFHPLGRTLFLIPFEDPDEIYRTVDRTVQTVSVFPWDYGAVIRDECARRGAARIVECGLNNVFRVGGAHDGIYPLQRLVRMVSNELPSKQRAKGINIPINQMEFLEYDKFPEFIP